MSANHPSLFDSFLFTLRQCVSNLACAPFFCFAILFYSFYSSWPYMEQLPDHLNIVAVDEDMTPLSRRLIHELKASPSVHVEFQAADQKEAERIMRQGGVSAILIIPPNFERDTVRDIPTALVLVSNGAFIVKARVSMSGAAGPLQEVVTAAIAGHLLEHGIPLDKLAQVKGRAPAFVLQPMFNTVNGYLNFTVPIVFVIIIQTVFIAGIGMLLNDWFWRRKYPYALALAMRSFPHFVAMYLPFFILAFLWTMYIEGASFAFHGVNAFRNVPATLAVAAVFSFAITSMAVMIAALCKRLRYIVQIIVPTSIPCVFLSGNLFPWQNFPEPILFFSKLLPSTPAAGAMLRASQAGATISEVVFPYLAHLLLLGMIFFTAAVLILRRYANDEQSLAQIKDLRDGIQNERLEKELTPKQLGKILGHVPDA